MNNKKLFCFDLDGTLLTTDKKISSKTYEALKSFTDNGNHFAINTGRAIDSALLVQEELNLFFKGSFIIGFNGSQIYDCDKKETVYRTGVPLDIVPDIFTIANKRGIHLHTYNDTHILANKDDEELKYYRRVIKSPVLFTSDVCSELSFDPCKLIAIELHDHDKIEAFRQEITNKYGDILTLLYSNPYYLEIFNKNAGKGSAVIRLCQYLDIPVSNSLAAGDEQNDISMIEAAGTGIAMLNATDMVKEKADVITATDNDNDGLVPFLIG